MEKTIPAIRRHDKRFLTEDMSGSVSFYPTEKITIGGKNRLVFYATPFWEEADGIAIGWMDSDCDYTDGETIPYKLTYDLVQDVVEYVKTMDEWAKKHSK